MKSVRDSQSLQGLTEPAAPPSPPHPPTTTHLLRTSWYVHSASAVRPCSCCSCARVCSSVVHTSCSFTEPASSRALLIRL